jgi:sec-independent protein translocase protein TatA
MIYLFLNSISTGEVIVIVAFILMFFGSKGVPGIARSLGKAMRQLRDATDDIKRDIRSSVDDIEKDVKKNMDGMNVKKELTEAQAAIQKNIDDIVKRPSRIIKDNVKEFKESVAGSEGKVKVSEKEKVVTKEKILAEEKVIEKVEVKAETVEIDVKTEPKKGKD